MQQEKRVIHVNLKYLVSGPYVIRPKLSAKHNQQPTLSNTGRCNASCSVQITIFWWSDTFRDSTLPWAYFGGAFSYIQEYL